MQVHKTVSVAKIPVLSKRLNVMTEPLPAREAIEGIEAISSYATFKQGEIESLLGAKMEHGRRSPSRKGIRSPM